VVTSLDPVVLVVALIVVVAVAVAISSTGQQCYYLQYGSAVDDIVVLGVQLERYLFLR